MSVNVVMSLVPVIRYRLQHMCSVYFSAHYDCERDERKFAVFAEALVQPEQAYEKAEAFVRDSYDAVLHRGMLIAKSLLRDRGSALGPY